MTELKVKEEDATSVRVTLNSLCRDNTDYIVQVSFGVREEGSNDECVPEQRVTADIVPGQSVILTVDTTTLILNPGQEYCYTKATLPESPGKYIWKGPLSPVSHTRGMYIHVCKMLKDVGVAVPKSIETRKHLSAKWDDGMQQ